MKKAEEAAKRAPKSEIEQAYEIEKQEVLRKGSFSSRFGLIFLAEMDDFSSLF